MDSVGKQLKETITGTPSPCPQVGKGPKAVKLRESASPWQARPAGRGAAPRRGRGATGWPGGAAGARRGGVAAGWPRRFPGAARLDCAALRPGSWLAGPGSRGPSCWPLRSSWTRARSLSSTGTAGAACTSSGSASSAAWQVRPAGAAAPGLPGGRGGHAVSRTDVEGTFAPGGSGVTSLGTHFESKDLEGCVHELSLWTRLPEVPSATPRLLAP